ncbi:hypothetical protein AMTRI_Chr03g51040 [Amborella trichopoda]|uniref:Uncharacterized protein n=1 Tax=Amborella trichopoda TaxID=13333 RepID=U5CZP2_AMBTC|nr:uncharacterized protein LOC18443920 [Amborella trichopoda]XP_020529046.1 uncharacterized protein LOC18443920 [Amborella trichopoda]ERN15629.1 hypothetical protein AMTR_s00048p00190950 [Amborella trichopoda]|eukprot:XP_006854162.1 uncharacterized protein LOC18443920 [Amborella trichopoda]
MEKNVMMVCIPAGFLGVVATVLGFAAEAKHVRAADVRMTDTSCIYPRSPALALGLTAAVALMLAQVILNTAAGCICCQRRPQAPSNPNWMIALICFIVSWITFVIAFLLFLAGAALNDQHGDESTYFGGYCFVVKSGVFSGGAILSLSSVALGIIYYVSLSSSKTHESWGNQNNQSIAMTQTTQPVFVPEDTYNRRQQFP